MKRIIVLVVGIVLLLMLTTCAPSPRITISGKLIGQEAQDTWLTAYTSFTLLMPDSTVYSFKVIQAYNLPLNQDYTFELVKSGDVLEIKKIHSPTFSLEDRK
jgi:hypothetical protein